MFLPLLVLLPTGATACGSGEVSFTEGSGAGSATSSTTQSNGGGGNGGNGGGANGGGGMGGSANGGSANGGSANGGSGGGTTSSSNGGAGTGGSMMVASDPAKDGPYQTTVLDENAPSGDHMVAIHAVYPSSGPEEGPYPVVVVAHGFQLPVKQYASYVARLATFGYVALTVDYQAGFTGSDNPVNAADLSAGLDWAAAKLPGKANSDLAGATGHSLGGKLALLAATKDARFKASIVLDPVDGGGGPGGGCQAPKCVDVSALMPGLAIPTGFLGETTDAAGGIQPCAPAAENFQTFYAKTNAPSLAVTVKGANHMSFLDDVASCGFTCNFCNMASAPNATVNALARAYVVAFYERYLRGNTAYDTYLTGAQAQALYVTPGLITIESK